MKSFKQFLEELHKIQTFRDKGYRTNEYYSPTGKYKKLELIPKPNTQAKLKDVNKKDYDNLQNKYNNEYKKFMNPLAPIKKTA